MLLSTFKHEFFCTGLLIFSDLYKGRICKHFRTLLHYLFLCTSFNLLIWTPPKPSKVLISHSMHNFSIKVQLASFQLLKVHRNEPSFGSLSFTPDFHNYRKKGKYPLYQMQGADAQFSNIYSDTRAISFQSLEHLIHNICEIWAISIQNRWKIIDPKLKQFFIEFLLLQNNCIDFSMLIIWSLHNTATFTA